MVVLVAAALFINTLSLRLKSRNFTQFTFEKPIPSGSLQAFYLLSPPDL
jgi:hypothetical protein